ncbi:hypothetical protein ACFE04_011436 [Oxalis oulophora]
MFNTSDESLIQFAQSAKNPFQFLAYVLAIERDGDLAKRTNFIQTPHENKIKDIYSSILEELKPFLHDNLDHTISRGVCSRINRKDFMCLVPANIWIFDRINKKRRKVTLRVPTQNRDRRKSEVSTFVNFIHQKDAFIAMSVVIQAACKYDVSTQSTTTLLQLQPMPMS